MLGEFTIMRERMAHLSKIEFGPPDMLQHTFYETTELVLGISTLPIPFTFTGDIREELTIFTTFIVNRGDGDEVLVGQEVMRPSASELDTFDDVMWFTA